jgi:indolepyruvate ferredoxin oxidoreductase alpha subunit
MPRPLLDADLDPGAGRSETSGAELEHRVLLGDESVALGALHAGVSAAYAYPGTPSTEILECLMDEAKRGAPVRAGWCANEKTAFETALGACFAGRRALVAMKHVGLNVAADPFVNAALVEPHGGLVLAVADDPGMHSSQNEQDSRFYADFARVPLLEPATQQECYDMTREAFDLSERFRVPVVVRLVTRLAHSRARVALRAPRAPNPAARAPVPTSWILLPGFARRQWRSLLARQDEIGAHAERAPANALTLSPRADGLGVITAGIARNYYEESLEDLDEAPSHLHIGVYPPPVVKLRRLARHVKRLLVLEDGQPFLERRLRGLLRTPVPIEGRETGAVPESGELDPDVVRAAFGLPARPRVRVEGVSLPARPPQLCEGCPHAFAFRALGRALEGAAGTAITGDIGCYTLGALAPYQAIQSCVCMGASIGMARGAAESGLRPVIAVIGDSTFLHSGITPLMEAAAADTDMTVIILDNEAVAMTGGQEPAVGPARLREVVKGLGVPPEHLQVVDAHPRRVRENGELLRREIAHRGLSVVIAAHPCLQTARQRARAAAGAVVAEMAVAAAETAAATAGASA